MSQMNGKNIIGTVVAGVALGVVLSGIGFTDWDEVHKMFAFKDLRMTLTFGTCVGVLGVGLFAIKKWKHPKWSPRKIHKGTVLGGVLFGVGWALSGACPSIALVQLGEGQLAALVTIVGIVIGNYAYSVIHQRYLKWDVQNCLDD